MHMSNSIIRDAPVHFLHVGDTSFTTPLNQQLIRINTKLVSIVRVIHNAKLVSVIQVMHNAKLVPVVRVMHRNYVRNHRFSLKQRCR